jgi:hypothetical protein
LTRGDREWPLDEARPPTRSKHTLRTLRTLALEILSSNPHRPHATQEKSFWELNMLVWNGLWDVTCSPSAGLSLFEMAKLN